MPHRLDKSAKYRDAVFVLLGHQLRGRDNLQHVLLPGSLAEENPGILWAFETAGFNFIEIFTGGQLDALLENALLLKVIRRAFVDFWASQFHGINSHDF